MCLKKLFGSLALFVVCAVRVTAAPLLFEGFERYNRGELDANDGSSTNATSIITNNPWAGPIPENLHILGVETNNGIVIVPHSGTNMARGRVPSILGGDFDQEYYNLGFWLNATNGGGSIFGNFYVDWWFFDPVGQGTNGLTGGDFGDYLALAHYTNIPTNAAYASDLIINGAGAPDVRFSLGGTDQQDAGFDGTNELTGFDGTRYQTRILGNTTNSYNANGWINLPISRGLGWHHARIEVSAKKPDSTYDARLFIDDLSHPLLTPNIAAPSGFNCLEINANFANISGYWDDITVDTLTRPTLAIARSGTNTILTFPAGFKLQSTPGLSPTAWADVLDGSTNFVSSPYTNTSAATQLFFRLRN